ncbi:MAG TPA: UpxY family transcription antiterminator [Candidatus Nanoarchaeia archaeon]|nr:UpxY family transcription antiterminator [Candidatus Nanoarchaeia archaeon]
MIWPPDTLSEKEGAVSVAIDKPGVEFDTPEWYIAMTKPRHEKRVAEQLAARGLTFYLPVHSAIRQWKNRRARVEFPLFPGYLFVHIAFRERLRALSVPGVLRFVDFGGRPAKLQQVEIDSLKLALAAGRTVEPHPFLNTGDKVRVSKGLLAGVEGILKKGADGYCLVVSVNEIMRSVSFDIDIAEIEVLKVSRVASPSQT